MISSFLAFTVKPNIIYKETLKTTFVTTDIFQLVRCLFKMKSDVYTMEKNSYSSYDLYWKRCETYKDH